MSTAQELQESLDGAKILQEKQLPPNELIIDLLHESFSLYLPKDKVSGDFYWLEVVNNEVLFAVADCTGHGVSGAMLTVKCIDLLNRSLKEHGCVLPGHILDKSLELILREFQNDRIKISDGMDIAICSLSENTLKYAGANNPLWIFRDDLVIELPSTRQGIGSIKNPVPYLTHEQSLIPGDTIYLFTDGFQDQLGGPNNKKYKVRNFKKFLLTISKKPLIRQKELVRTEITNWIGDKEQTDDITIMAVRIQ